MRRCVLLAAVFLAGCTSPQATTSTKLTLNDGRSGHRVDCSLSRRGDPECLTKASELCPLGYYALDIGTRQMTIRCKTHASE
jgi:hypothetical protein